MKNLVEELDERSAEIRFEVIDFSLGELIRLHQDNEINIQPAFQRMFRWSQGQQSRLIESILLGLPIPQIVLFQKSDGVLELIDGLQRVSSIIRYVTGKTPKEATENQDTNTALAGCDVLPSLNGKRFNDLEPVVQLEFKRKTFRAIVIRRTNDPNLRYEMFKRLNTGGSQAEPHEVRNASLRIVGETGEKFLEFLQRCADNASFQIVTDTLSEQAKRRLGQQELVLRFFALKNFRQQYRGNITDWLDNYSEAVVKTEMDFNYAAEEKIFEDLFRVISEKLGIDAFLKHKGGRTLGGLAPAYFDAVTMGLLPVAEKLNKITPEKAKEILDAAISHENEDFRENVGPGANATPRMEKRIEIVRKAFETALT